MHDVILMYVANSLDSLYKKFEWLQLAESGSMVLMVKQVSLFCIFHNHIDGLIFNESVPQTYQMRMV